MKKILVLLFLPFLGISQQLTTQNILFDGNNREYIIYVPQIYAPSISTPLLFAFHGGSGYANDFMNYEADFRSISDTAGFILVYPQALEDPNDDKLQLIPWDLDNSFENLISNLNPVTPIKDKWYETTNNCNGFSD